MINAREICGAAQPSAAVLLWFWLGFWLWLWFWFSFLIVSALPSGASASELSATPKPAHSTLGTGEVPNPSLFDAIRPDLSPQGSPWALVHLRNQALFGEVLNESASTLSLRSVSYTHLTLPTTPYV